MGFLPDGYERQSGGKGFYEFEIGDNKMRVLSKPVMGNELWVGGKPIRKPFDVEFTKEELANADVSSFTGKKRTPVEFWGLVIWDYRSEKVVMFNFNQKEIIEGILDLLDDDAWGDVRNFDINIKKIKAERVKYVVSPIPPKPLTDEIKQAYEESDIDLNKLFDFESLLESDINKHESDNKKQLPEL